MGKEVKEFNRRVQKYVEIHRKAVDSVPTPKTSTDPALIVRNQQALAAVIRASRPSAMPGEIFVPRVRPMFVRIIKQQLQGKQGKRARATVLDDGNPKSPESPAKVKLSINADYPADAPLSSVPPSLLMALPSLPEQLEYRFVGRTLILRDTKANIIVDFIEDVVP